MIILSLDLATNTGWAVYDNGKITFGSINFALKRGESAGMRFLRCRSWLRDMSDLLSTIDLIVCEQPHHRGGYATACAMGLYTEACAFAAQCSAQTTTVHATKLKKWSTGKGNASKDEMIAEARRRGHQVANDDEADAVLMLEYTLDDLNIKKNDTARSRTTKKLVRRC